MIKKLSSLQRLIVCHAVDFGDWKELRQGFEKDDFGPECSCKWDDNGKIKGDICDHCLQQIDSGFEVIGYFGSSHWIIGVKKPWVLIRDLWFEIRYWFKYSVLKQKFSYYIFDKSGKF